ncbi:DNA-binding NtrC family response regulator [Flavobacterium sp. 270]|uniref:sigma-54-dependent transcriptional regulator n=1 Tax=Flavobacterium sp. 270 TaxID=2512114 RepID=UPI0010660E59|nr:sigma-54 dependent transcriptional regulator [Flavobacterium sp. 270]TDW47780.1 DNA-binding NtrC family response regulator [Flavobacterium sp. 270]
MENKVKILIVEDEFIVANDLKIILKKNNFDVIGIASSADQAKAIIKSIRPDWVLLDIIIEGNETGIDLAHDLMKQKIPYLFVSANTNQSTLQAVKKTHPYGFLVKPFRRKDLLVMLDIARYRYAVENQNQFNSEKKENTPLVFTGIVGSSPPLKEIFSRISIVAPTEASVLITGETGTGKEKIAHAVHENSLRRNKKMIVVNCAAIPFSLLESELFGFEKGAFTGAVSKRIGKFEQAEGGTLFLDEIGELSLDAQAKLLRVLQEKEIERIGGTGIIKVDVRIIAATNRSLEREVAEGRFRLDLYYRLNVFLIELLPLRERKQDILELAQYFMKNYNTAFKKNIKGITSKVLSELQSYSWPGNIRELEHLIERSVLLAETEEITKINLPANIEINNATKDSDSLESLQFVEKNHIMKILNVCNGKIYGDNGAAAILKISPVSLYAKMKKLGIGQEYF